MQLKDINTCTIGRIANMQLKDEDLLVLSVWLFLQSFRQYSGPYDLRPLYLTIPCIIRPDISDTTCIFSV